MSYLLSETILYALRGVQMENAFFRPRCSGRTLIEVASSIRKNPSFFLRSRK